MKRYLGSKWKTELLQVREFEIKKDVVDEKFKSKKTKAEEDKEDSDSDDMDVDDEDMDEFLDWRVKKS